MHMLKERIYCIMEKDTLQETDFLFNVILTKKRYKNKMEAENKCNIVTEKHDIIE